MAITDELRCILELLEQGFYELKFAFEGMDSINLWRRPAESILSAGEIAGHLAYWEAVRLAGEGEDLSLCNVKSLLVDNRFRYFSHNLPSEISPELAAMSPEDVWFELQRVHAESLQNLDLINPDTDAKIPGDPSGFTYKQYLQYAVFHTAYHCGQIYTIRHLLGETTPDN